MMKSQDSHPNKHLFFQTCPQMDWSLTALQRAKSWCPPVLPSPASMTPHMMGSTREGKWSAHGPLHPCSAPAVSDCCCVTQEAVWRDGAADGRCDRLGRLPNDSSVPRVARLRLPGLEERHAGHSGIRGDGVCLWQTAELHLHEGVDICLLSPQHISVLIKRWLWWELLWRSITVEPICPSRFTVTTCSPVAWRSSPPSPVGLSPASFPAGSQRRWFSTRCWTTRTQVLATWPYRSIAARQNPSAVAFSSLTCGWCSVRSPFSRVTTHTHTHTHFFALSCEVLTNPFVSVHQKMPFSRPK